mmetsp:Transcript_37627/g.86911  ORF Transcript_37627/g.86911 Transcript_37627/m.86911 type:complete len:162 (-) Transcript_37627:33-518(-)
MWHRSAPTPAALLFLVVVANGSLGAELCAELGFSETLDCSACDKLNDFLTSRSNQKVKNDVEVLIKECRGCCVYAEVEKYDKAVLQMSPGRTRYDQDLEDFVRRKAPAFTRLQIEETAGVTFTMLHFLREGQTVDTAAESINLHSWKTDELRDFLQTRLKP